jgi:Fic family protein
MLWNWQQPDWPNFHWNRQPIRKAEARFLLDSGTFSGSVRHLRAPDREQLAIESISKEALTTSEIEGETLDHASVQSSIRRHLGLPHDKRRPKPAEDGIAELVVDLYRTFAQPLSATRLFAWHRFVSKGSHGLQDVGRYRAGSEPMQIISGRIGSPRVHFEAPPAARVPVEMARFIDWFNRTAPSGDEPLPALTRAGIAHLYFESIHPFEDGNGRLGRAIAEKAMAQAIGQPTLNALAATILLRRKNYYASLEKASRTNQLTEWLVWFAGICLEAQQRTAARVDFILDQSRLLETLSGRLNPRQEKVLQRLLREGPEGFVGGLSAANYSAITKASSATTTRDLAELVTLGALTRTGEHRYARYTLNIPLRPVAAITIDANGNFKQQPPPSLVVSVPS